MMDIREFVKQCDEICGVGLNRVNVKRLTYSEGYLIWTKNNRWEVSDYPSYHEWSDTFESVLEDLKKGKK
jgi:hypothetical protein